jgi:glutamate/tyrosine decarboxylase-like PLP-dependent enzyme
VDENGSRDFVPSITLRESTVKQFEALKGADSITIDPHKAWYIPYPAGALCYRDGRMRFLVTWTAPYLHDGSDGESIGVYGIEGR